MRMWWCGQLSVDCVTLSSSTQSRAEKVTNVFLWPAAAKSGHMTPAMTWREDMTWHDMTWHDTGAMLPLVSVVSLLSVSQLVMETSASLVAGINTPHYCDKIAEILYWQYKFVFILFYSNVQIVQPIKRFKQFSTTCVYVLNVLVLCPRLLPRGSALMVPFRLFAVLCRIEKSEDWPTYSVLMKFYFTTCLNCKY